MTDSERKDLIKKLAAKSNRALDERYDEDNNRKWFVEKVIASLPWQTTAAADIESKTKDIITKAGVLLNARRTKGFSAGSLTIEWKTYDQLKSRIQIIYGMIAMHPQFVDPANEAYFDFILERRFRSIQRMNFFVNPNATRNVFAYPRPSTTPPEKMKVNGHSDLLWTGVLNGSLPFILTSAGKSKPEDTIEKLFIPNKGTNRNLFACDPVATVLHMDALRAAKNADKLLNALISINDHYLKIDNPFGHFGYDTAGQRLLAVTTGFANKGSNVEIPVGRIGGVLAYSKVSLTAAMLTTNAPIPIKSDFFMIVHGDKSDSTRIVEINPVTKKIKFLTLSNDYPAGAKVYARKDTSSAFSTLLKTLPFHFIADSRPDHALFEQLTVKAEDLQVGDHVLVLNHPLYKVFRPEGFWGGEHSFISEIGSRDSASSAFRSSLEVEGHGLSSTLLGMANEMLEFVNTDIGRVQAVIKLHLENLKANGRKTTTKVKFSEPTETLNGAPTVMNVFEYNIPYSYTHFEKGKKTSKTVSAGFVIKEVKGRPEEIQAFNLNGKDASVAPTFPQPDVFFRVIFIGTNFASDQFKLSSWAIVYINPQAGSFDAHPLFETSKLPKLLTFDDLAKSKPIFATDELGDAFVTRPRVDFSPAYQTFLKSNGAI
jgi:hypothetical protein